MTRPNSQLQKIDRRFRPLYAGQFFQGFVLWYAIEKVFMKSIGLSNAAIAFETVLFTAVLMVANIPFGILADRWSRKGVLILSSLALIASTVICGLSHSFWPYAIGGACWGLFFAASNGTYESIVYDALLEETGNSDEFEHYYGRIQLFDSVAMVVGSLLSAVVVHFSGLRAAYFLTIPAACCSILAFIALKEPAMHRKQTAELMSVHIKATFGAIMRKGQVFWIVATIVLIGATMRIMFELDQLWLFAVALPLTLYGPVNALVLSGGSLSGLVAKRVKRSGAGLGLVGLLVIAASCCLLTHERLLIILAQFVLVIGLLSLDIILGRYLHDTMPSTVRAGASSVVTTLGYLLFLPLGLLFGTISSRVSVFRAAWIVVGLVTGAFVTSLIMLTSCLSAQAIRD